jgi:hypothetical protein
MPFKPRKKVTASPRIGITKYLSIIMQTINMVSILQSKNTDRNIGLKRDPTIYCLQKNAPHWQRHRLKVKGWKKNFKKMEPESK